MARDVDLMRLALLELKRLQRSPPEGFLLPLDDIAHRLERPRSELVEALELLRELDFIEAPGAYFNGAWIFRKLTKRGDELAELILDERDWGRVKEAYADLLER
ncbi:hypothetical protein [Methylocystis parvus]|uniref:Uncharacterized protein n=1 Tax=Methylocystis parvus TaxID=134 RepID=A0A6B8M5E9_9HYPH|nr:hypothetical protein [Methylocystis parvus]QGM97596.1 hypothetical protein F7D14_09070 [Methylocystis parvus]WBJ98472.1 hypothetical protein MMG94_10525 [Methylocystis parvus OBBP]